MAKTSVIKVTNVFEDDTKNTLTINNVNADNVNTENIKNRVKSFNADNSGYRQLMTSKYGNYWQGISKVVVQTTERTYLY